MTLSTVDLRCAVDQCTRAAILTRLGARMTPRRTPCAALKHRAASVTDVLRRAGGRAGGRVGLCKAADELRAARDAR